MRNFLNFVLHLIKHFQNSFDHGNSFSSPEHHQLTLVGLVFCEMQFGKYCFNISQNMSHFNIYQETWNDQIQ